MRTFPIRHLLVASTLLAIACGGDSNLSKLHGSDFDIVKMGTVSGR